MVVLISPRHRRPRMAIIARTLARIKSDPLVLLGGAEAVNDHFARAGHLWRERALDPATTLYLFVRQILAGNPPSPTCVTWRIWRSPPAATARRASDCRWRRRPLWSSAFLAIVLEAFDRPATTTTITTTPARRCRQASW